ncbi:MAG TPA: universal stress protein [Candidatus Angelobacter sp.]|nr:universal stress protein [Candidatus Angelobacter sp.]
MYKHILIPTDGSELAGKAVEHGLTLAKQLGAKVTIATVWTPYHIWTLETRMVEDTPAEYKAHMREQAAKLLSGILNSAKAAGIPCDTLQVEHEHAYQAIIDAAKSNGCDLIVMASHGRRGISAIILGSVTVKVLTHSRIPVLVHR